MCLDKVTGKPAEESGVGYKVFESDASYHLCFAHFAPKGGARIRYEYWYKDENEEDIRVGEESAYPAGFHIYKKRPEENHWYKIREVSYRKAHTIGVQDRKSVIVAKELFIHRPTREEHNEKIRNPIS